MTRGLILLIVAIAACGGEDGGPDAPPARTVDLTATVGADGRSEPVAFVVPEGTRSIGVTIHGESTALYALAALTLADGVDLVALPPEPPGPAMRASYIDEQIGQMPGGLYQSIRLGEFTHVHPNKPGLAAQPGAATLRVASDTPGPVTIRIVMRPDTGATRLVMNVIVVSDTIDLGATPAFVGETATYLGAANVTVELGRVIAMPGTPYENITDLNEPQEPPTSQSAQLPGVVATMLADDPGIDIFIVESLPSGIAGLSLGTPGPPERRGYYYGVVIAASRFGLVSGRTVAHEVGHFLGLQHLVNVGISGTEYPDQLDDTESGSGNLMEGGGTTLTPDQAWVLSRSPLLVN